MAINKYKYVATDQNNNQVEGTREAESREQLAEYLQSQGLLVVSIQEDFNARLQKLGDIQVGGIGLKDRMYLAKQLSTMLNAGLPVLQVLEILSKQMDNKQLKESLVLVKKDVEGGLPLSSAFQKNSEVFSEVQLNLIAAGEKSGNMVEVMQQIAIDMEKSYGLRSKIRSAMIYPVIIVIAVIGVLVMMVTVMIPTVKDLYRDFNAEDQIPEITKFLISVSDFFTNPIGLIVTILIIIISIATYQSFKSSASGKLVIARMQLKMPVFGKLSEKIQLAQFGRLMSMMLMSGVSIIDALKIVSKALENPVFTKSVEQAAQEVSKGTPLAIPLAKTGIFPLLYIRMISTGEQTGNLDQILADLGKFYEDEVNETTENLTKLMEPLILLVVGGMIGFLAMAVYLPIYNIGTVIS